MIVQSAFIAKNRMLRGGLHCHTTRSDGKGDPADVMRVYASRGYDFLAITDHRRYNFENYAPETGLTIIPGMEMDRNISSDAGMCFHIVSIGPEKGNGFTHDQRFESGTVSDQYEMQPVIDMLHANNNLTIYCHPDWSCTPARSFENMQGNFAVEVWNTGCVFENDMDKDAPCWDELLTRGKPIFGVATDDGHAMNQHGWGWVMVNAENNVDSILAALEKGAFYSSTGPEIYDFHVDGDRAFVECSPCKFVNFVTGTRPNVMVAEDGGVTRAEIKIPSQARYIRATIVDAEGRRAWTNPIFLDEPRLPERVQTKKNFSAITNKKIVSEMIRYLIFGVLTTLVNFVVYFAGLKIFGEESYLVSNVIAWIFAVAFAYVTNKIWVFASKSWAWRHIRTELAGFISARIFSLAVEEAGLWLMIGLLSFESWTLNIPGYPIGGGTVAKLIMQFVVIVMNYVFSKLIIFKKKAG